MMQSGRRPLAALLLLGIAIAGCTATTNGSTSTLTINTPGTIPPHARITPLPVINGPPPNGTFSGVGRLSNSVGSGCRTEIPVNGMVVTGSRVRWQGFRGTISAGGLIDLQAGSRFLYGTFDGPSFVGHLWQPHPACTYDLTLNHVG
jgi:hypothetical protein